MALALSKQVRDEVVAFSAAVAEIVAPVVRWRAFAAEKTAAIVAWPKQPDGTLNGYRITVAELVQINALADDLATLGATHAAALATLRRLS